MELRLPSPEQLRTVYYRDLKEAFPAAELKPLRNIENCWAEGWYKPYCLFDGDSIVGEAFLWLGHPGWALLDYLCVAPDRRSDGLGGEMLRLMRAGYPGWTILAEAEAPAYAPDPAMAERRLGFYRRNGAALAGYDSEAFGVRYKTIYWPGGPVTDGELAVQHRFINESRFGPEKYARYVRIPCPSGAEPMAQVPWDE